MENKEVENLEEVKVEEVKEEVKEDEEIVFHDAGPQVEVVKPQGGMSKLAIIAFILVLISAPLAFIPTSNLIVVALYNICSFGGFILSIVALVQIKAKNQKGKVFAILGIVGTVLVFVASLIVGIIQITNMPEEEFNDLIYCPYATNCVKKDDKTSTCLYVDDSEVTCTTELLKDEQFEDEK